VPAEQLESGDPQEAFISEQCTAPADMLLLLLLLLLFIILICRR
jgi:hypothetical protein